MFENFSFTTSSPGRVSVANSFVSLFIFYTLSYLLSKTMGCLYGCLMSSASIQKLFCGICSAFKCSFDEFVGEKVVSVLFLRHLLNLFIPSILCSSPVAYWALTDPGSSSFSFMSFCLFLLFMGFLWQEYRSGLPFPSPVGHVLSELSTMTHLSWVALHSIL